MTKKEENIVIEAQECAYSLFEQVMDENENNQPRLDSRTKEYIARTLESADRYDTYVQEMRKLNLNAKEQQLLSIINKRNVPNAKRLVRRWIIGVSAAAIIAISMLIFTPKTDQQKGDIIAIGVDKELQVIEPTLIVANNNSYVLSEATTINSIISSDGGTKATNELAPKQEYNTIIVPSKHSYKATLPDGSIVTLNANSRLEFPSNFSATERKVSLYGEAYFEVNKGSTPFIVSSCGTTVMVYGTKFNVRAVDSTKVETVLVSGSVGVTNDTIKNYRMLVPNQRAQLSASSQIVEVDSVNAHEYIEWLGGSFNYTNRSFDMILRDLASWYGVTFNVEANIVPSDVKLTLFTPKSDSITEVIDVIELISNYIFIREGGDEYTVSRIQ